MKRKNANDRRSWDPPPFEWLYYIGVCLFDLRMQGCARPSTAQCMLCVWRGSTYGIERRWICVTEKGPAGNEEAKLKPVSEDVFSLISLILTSPTASSALQSQLLAHSKC